MTLKERVAQVEPDHIRADYTGGVWKCPGNYTYLNDTKSLENGSCYFTNCDEETCADCWSREFIPPAEPSRPPGVQAWVLNGSEKGVFTDENGVEITTHYASAMCPWCGRYAQQLNATPKKLDYLFCPWCGRPMTKEEGGKV